VEEIGHGYRPELECWVSRRAHPLAEGVPSAFAFASSLAYYETEDPEAVTYVKCVFGDVAMTKTAGLGRIVLIGSDYSLYTDGSARLLANALRMVSDDRGTRFVRGDVNADAQIDLADPIRIITYLFAGDAEPDCLDAADANNDAYLGSRAPVDIADAIYLLGFLFAWGEPPPPPFRQTPPSLPRDCGFDPEMDDGIDCRWYPPCE
jgi:hypothetical protein